MAIKQSQLQDGYIDAAVWMAQDPDSEIQVFRKFDALALLNLLYFQSQILELESRLHDLNMATTNAGDLDIKQVAENWEMLVAECKQEQCRQESRMRMDLIKELRQTLKEYHEALLLQSQIANMKRPNDRVLSVVRHYFQRPHHILGGKAKTFLDDKLDLVTMKAVDNSDALSTFLRQHWTQGAELSRDGKTGIATYKDNDVAIVVNIVTLIIAAVFLIGTIVTFYFLERAETKLAMIALFTIGFAASIALVTNARRVELFAATAAYAAVLVVFVSNGSITRG